MKTFGNKSVCIDAIADAIHVQSCTSANFIGADGHHVIPFCVRFCDRNHLVDCVFFDEATGLLRVRLTVRCDRSHTFEVYAAELPIDALETIACIIGEIAVNHDEVWPLLSTPVLPLHAPAAVGDADGDPADEDDDEAGSDE